MNHRLLVRHLRPVLLLLPLVLVMLGGCRSKPPLRTRTLTDTEQSGLPALDLKREPELRILLSQSISAVELRSSRGFAILDGRGRELARYGSGRGYHFFQERRRPDGLEVYTDRKRGGRRSRAFLRRLPFRSIVYLQPARGGTLTVNGRSYRGRIKLHRQGGRFNCLNLLPLELYLRGVVPHEIGHLRESGFAAMMAQAVASRSYAIQRLRDSQDKPWDMVDTVYDQVYRGAEDEWRWANKAIEATRGQVLWAGDEQAEVYYASTCGGATTGIDEVWEHGPVDHLVSMRDSDSHGRSWCRSSKYFRWRYSWSAKELGEILRAYLPKMANLPAGTRIGHLEDIRITATTQEGRAKLLEVVTDRGRYTVKGDRIRSALKRDLKGNALRSTFFRMKVERDGRGRLVRVLAHGAGWGHGIGMCQVGAIARSKSGHPYDRILGAYYPGTRLKRLWH